MQDISSTSLHHLLISTVLMVENDTNVQMNLLCCWPWHCFLRQNNHLQFFVPFGCEIKVHFYFIALQIGELLKQIGSRFKKTKLNREYRLGISEECLYQTSSVFISDIQGSKGNIHEICSYMGNLVAQTFIEVKDDPRKFKELR